VPWCCSRCSGAGAPQPWTPRGALLNKLFLRAVDVQVLLGAHST